MNWIVGKVVMSLNVTVSNANDYGRYYCVSKNEMGIMRGSINIFGQSPNQILADLFQLRLEWICFTMTEVDPQFVRPPSTANEMDEPVTYGPAPPGFTDVEVIE